MPAVCHCCGMEKSRPMVPCKHCGVSPIEEDREVAWLLSDAYLTPEELNLVATRLQRGEVIKPSRRLRRHARRKLGFSQRKERLSDTELFLLSVGNLFFTPLLGVAIWLGYRYDMPKIAIQAIMSSIFAAVLTSVVVGLILFEAW